MSGSETESGAGVDPRRFRNVLGQFCTGVTIITTVDDGAPVGFACQSFAALSLEPPLVLFCPTKASRSWAAIERSGRFCVNVLSRAQADLCWKFAKSGDEHTRFDGVAWKPAPTGSPIIARAVAWIDCTTEQVYEMGDHYFVLGRVVALDADPDGDGDGPHPLLFFKGTLGGFTTEG